MQPEEPAVARRGVAKTAVSTAPVDLGAREGLLVLVLLRGDLLARIEELLALLLQLRAVVRLGDNSSEQAAREATRVRKRT